MAMNDTYTVPRDDVTGREAPGWRPPAGCDMPEPLEHDPDFTNPPVFTDGPPCLAALTPCWLEGGEA